jgi:hypothetical protein
MKSDQTLQDNLHEVGALKKWQIDLASGPALKLGQKVEIARRKEKVSGKVTFVTGRR